LFRIVAVEGPQVADFNAWNLDNPRERFWASRTKQLHRAHVTTYDRLWSSLPYLRPMLTITNDTIRYGLDDDGAGWYDLLCTRCDPYVHKAAQRRGLRSLLPLQPRARGRPLPPDRARRPRRAQYLPGHRAD